MKHLRQDYQGIQDTTNQTSIGQDEPIFLIRAKDVIGSQAVRVWAAYALHAGGDPAMCARVQEWADEMDAYRREHFGGGKVPDVPVGMLLPSTRQQVPFPRFCGHCGTPLGELHRDGCYMLTIG